MSSKPILQAIKRLLGDFPAFSRQVIKVPLYDYQLQVTQPIIDSIQSGAGDEYLLIFPRQSGKNEVTAQLLVYFLVLFQKRGGNIVFAATGDGAGRGARRLDDRLDNAWTRGKAKKQNHPARRTLQKASVVFLSAHPLAASRGETAHHALFIDEVQDINGPHLEAVFTPMRAANNATAVYLGTVKTTRDFLWQKKMELERLTAADGKQRVFHVSPEEVIAENPAYATFLQTQIQKHGKNHPIIQSEYFGVPIDAAGGLFDRRRQALMRGEHDRRKGPELGHIYAATIDIGGQDEAATDPVAQLANPGRDYTVVTIFDVIPEQLPVYCAVDVLVDHGSRHFETYPGMPKLADKIDEFLGYWNVDHVVVDASGVGQGLASHLTAQRGRDNVTAFSFATRGVKAALASRLLAIIETHRFKYWSDDAGQELSDGWWFWQQCTHCGYDLPPEGRFEKDLQWGVPATLKIPTSEGNLLVHDDRLLSAALIAEYDRLIADQKLSVGYTSSVVLQSADPYSPAMEDYPMYD